MVVAHVSNTLEYGDAVVTARHRLSVEDARAGAKANQSIDNQREPAGDIVARRL